ncbi:tRNA uridine-5-carboxymethylaminomethyl(34) synthesis GTPase MnmE [Eubacterium sp. LFL-14]|uniref:tRNA modification GTPase MnmE n=1 Tax=Eubacterium album TaxID=2978477 RepID=A0ABT2LZC9_9FIRM|nr:tRNA uridine-5-carboxymethylaminomethyl(34) synthesis GTPase MnmE [Eubacterium sp. LFL-14]MCT7398646.1 tRNA uridine-5-carboxymethylaminomethyl(34) synthesis GTPase MnmE [Eubacterium sp. LFL-14]
MKVVDTIAAIATASGNSGIGIIRVSGDEAIEIVDKIFKSVNSDKKLVNVKSHTINYGHIVDNDKVIDEVLVSVMNGPHSYTGEDVVEINCHGGMIVIRKILEIVLKNGARTAEPGEFTKRAFLNGRMDLSQAEAVMDVINAKNEFALSSSIEQLNGRVSEKIKSLRKKIIYNIAFIESALDDPEHISIDGYSDKLSKILEEVNGELSRLINNFDNGRIVKEGVKTVILGKPNAGKSSLLNLLLGEERAIVTDIEGTTRDTLEESINLNGVFLNLIDTAGIRDSEDVVEQIGVNKAKELAEKSDLVIFVADASKELDENDKEIINLIKDKQAIVLLNKSDLGTIINEKNVSEFDNKPVITFSAKTGDGLDELENKIRDLFYEGKVKYNDELYITNARQKESLINAKNSIEEVIKSVENDMPEDFYSIDLMDAYTYLGQIIGESVEDDLVNEIFSKFCMGK